MIRTTFSCLCTLVLLSFSSSYAQTTPPMKARLNHIALYVSDLKKSTAFYEDIVQLDTIPEPFHDGKHTWFLVAPLSHLHLIEGLKESSSREKNTHLCFTVASVPEFIKILDAHHIEYEDWPGHKMQVTKRVDGVFQIYFKDPDGYWIEINDAKS